MDVLPTLLYIAYRNPHLRATEMLDKVNVSNLS